ncbi:adenine deaminase [Halodesulfovibrio sp.]|jgi:adenine deaminase|uniref:adenine deaminase n=1 Tax=Halodesulfovibrio sp. TaxID=1912772 RepID=UPI0025DC2DAE|nr:adenine deaminase [Halodesulfovibrio sp.]MCT4535429.1 adenine deaminase [Halodesulfovibrio sp.]MCT4626242.1 adenine deaminase [Halodesulfovibrio sp.]
MTEREALARRIDMAAGRIPVDTLITNCKVVDVFSQTIFESSVAIGDGKIVGFGEYKAEKIIDAKNGYLMPGLIDGHVHIESSVVSPAQFAKCVLPYGTTTIIADPHEIANVCGLEGIRYMLDASKDLPLNVRIMLPSCVPATPFENSGATLGAKELSELIDHEGVHGLAEVMNFPGVINSDPSVLDKIDMATSHGLLSDGHSPGLTGQDLIAYAAAGIKTDHECSSVQEMEERIRLGMYVLIREGSATKDLRTLAKGLTDANYRRCVFCTDDREPADIIANGHINKNLKIAVEEGIDALQAITIGTLNAAECYGLKGKGAIAPGYDADIMIVRDLTQFEVSHVFTSGKQIAENGTLLVEPQELVRDTVRDTVNISDIKLDDLKLKLSSNNVRTIHVIPDTVLTESVTKKVILDEEGCFNAQQNKGLAKIAVVERHNATGNVGLGIFENYHIENGAIATTIAHDSHNIVVAGDNDEDMLVAINDLKEIGGGITLVREGKVLGHLSLPIAGLMSDQPAQEVATQMEELLTLAKEFNINPKLQPFMTLSFMSLPVIPALKLTDGGLFDVTTFSFVPVEIED